MTIKKPRRVVVNDDVIGVSSTYNASKTHIIDLKQPPLFPVEPEYFQFLLEQIRINIKSISGGASKIIFKICADSSGNETVIPSTSLTIDIGTSDVSLGSVSARLNIIPYLASDVVYLFFKTNTGTVTIDQSIITWSE